MSTKRKETTHRMSEADARRAGYRPLTIAIRLPAEQRILDNVLSDMTRGGVDHILVPAPDGFEVWRRAPKPSNNQWGAVL
jgi:hypothetical protein